MTDDDEIHRLHKEEIGVQTEILQVLRRWYLTSVYIAVILTLFVALRLSGVK
jgi:hypothetical protein